MTLSGNRPRRLVFPEFPGSSLGYSKGHTEGSAIGAELAGQLTSLAKEIIDAGIQELEIFELVGLLQEGIGADRVSDMTVRIILPDLLAFTARVAEGFGVQTKSTTYQDVAYQLPVIPSVGHTVLLVPHSLLRNLPVAESWEDIDRVASHNQTLRNRVNSIIGSTWKRATSRRVSKATLRNTLLQHPELIHDLVDQYRRKPAQAYDFDRDPAGQHIWNTESLKVASAEPLDLSGYRPAAPGNIVSLVQTICMKFKQLVEANRFSRVLYNDDGSTRKERTAQQAFFVIATTYCEANNVDISPEADAGAGPVDFKLSQGFRNRVLVEVKLSSNQRLLHGFDKQLPAYAAAESSMHNILLVIQTANSDSKIKKLRKKIEVAKNSGQTVPELIVVDGRLSPSASKL